MPGQPEFWHTPKHGVDGNLAFHSALGRPKAKVNAEPQPMCWISCLVTSSRSGSGNCSGSRLAAPSVIKMRSPSAIHLTPVSMSSMTLRPVD